jgi:type IV pilus assembly protein PilB
MSQLNGFAKYLVTQQLLSAVVIEDALIKAAQEKITLIKFLAVKGLLAAKTLAEALASYFSLPFQDLEDECFANIAWEVIPEKLIFKYQILPLSKSLKQMTIAVFDPTEQAFLQEIKFHSQCEIKLVIIAYDKLQKFLQAFADEKRYQSLEMVGRKDETQDFTDAPVVKFLEEIFADALVKNASDIHFEPYAKKYRVRFRIDGLLHEVTSADLRLAPRFSARLKIMAHLNIAERRLPQDGRFTLDLAQQKVRDCRLSTCPTLHGEKIVVRILEQQHVTLSLEELGLEKEQQKIFLENIARPEGMILVTGPTGSGKTISLYTALNILNSEYKNITTVEDPVEIAFDGINQVEANAKIGLTFANVLRAFLRQDPDIIMLGEIRDAETAQIAVKAAQTGHLVLATLHTNNAVEALTRLLNLGVAPFNLANSINLIIAQRLVRKLCPFCKKARDFSMAALDEKVGVFPSQALSVIYQARGCEHCYKGYQGRIGIFELLPFTQQLGEILLKSSSSLEVAAETKRQGMQSLRDIAYQKVMQGITSLEEVNRIIT